MPQEPSPEPGVPPEDGTSHTAAPGPEGDGRPKGLLEQMDELMAALNADLTRLDADLQSTVGPPAPREEAELSGDTPSEAPGTAADSAPSDGTATDGTASESTASESTASGSTASGSAADDASGDAPDGQDRAPDSRTH